MTVRGGRRADALLSPVEAEPAAVVARWPAGVWIVVCTALSVAAFAARSWPLLALLAALDAALALALCRQRWRLLRDAARLFLWQTAVIAGLYALRFGTGQIEIGVRTSCQLLLAFVPGMVLVRGLPPARLARAFAALLSDRAAFVLTTSLRFVPLLLREVRQIHEVQVLRGARVLPRDLARPWHWPDLVRCVLVPAVIQTLVLASRISLAARARDFGLHPRRTYWPGA